MGWRAVGSADSIPVSLPHMPELSADLAFTRAIPLTGVSAAVEEPRVYWGFAQWAGRLRCSSCSSCGVPLV